MNALRSFRFQESERGERLDVALVGRLPIFSRAQIRRLVAQGSVTLNGVVPRKAGLTLRGNEKVTVRVPPPAPAAEKAEPIPLDIVYEDDDLMVIDKPPGMVVHPAAGHRSGTLVNAVLAHAPGMAGVGGERRPGIVHRLDKDTSGLIVVAKNDTTHRLLQAQFKQRTVEKRYLALVCGAPPSPTGRVEAAIGRDRKHRKRMAVFPSDSGKGRAATSTYRTMQSFRGYTLVEVRPLTGRTHQVRVHMAFLGCPLAGDALYGGRRSGRALAGLGRQFLHAAGLKLALPGGAVREFGSPLPADLERAIAQLRAD
ncbi:MAG TPA: RluA family pseudouridine synthase [Anaerolineales bacterium]|nr:RluA family pseudouridine synthase [Anaerolineales bacterium]